MSNEELEKNLAEARQKIAELENNKRQAFWQAEYFSVSNKVTKFLDIYIKAIIVYFSVMGVLLGFALDNDSPAELKIALCFFALACCVLFLFSTKLADRIIKRAQDKRKHALDKLDHGSTKDLFKAGSVISKVCRTFNMFAMVGWSFIILYIGVVYFSFTVWLFILFMGGLLYITYLFLKVSG